jgi:hypothetical protein
MTTRWLEFHDSTVAAVNYSGNDVEVVLDGYVHRWDAVGDSATGTGWVQPVRILIGGVGGTWMVPVLPIDISDGRLRVGATRHDNMVGLPFLASGAISLWLQFVNADMVEFVGRRVHIDAIGEARFVEDLPADLRPGSQ